MSDYKKLLDIKLEALRKFEEDLFKLQQTCPHLYISDWMLLDYKHDAKCCNNCAKIIEKRIASVPVSGDPRMFILGNRI